MKKLSLMLVCYCLVHAVFAFHNPQMGRWMTRDPIEEKGGENLYAFCENDPISNYDKLSLDVTLTTGNKYAEWWKIINRWFLRGYMGMESKVVLLAQDGQKVLFLHGRWRWTWESW